MKKLKQTKGITLIALVITIIVLLILAGITINLTIGQDGILKRAQEAGKNYTNAADYERKQLAELNNEVDNIINGIGGSKEPTIPALGTIIRTENNINYTADGVGNVIPVPVGFNPITTEDQGTKETGFVIKDITTNEDGTPSVTNGNEFVWVPCTIDGANDTIEYNRYSFEGFSNSNYSEEMPSYERTSVEIYGGFYIGRYEVGVIGNTGTVATSNSSNSTNWTGYSNGTAVVQKDKQVWNYVTRDKAKEIAEGMYTDLESVTSRLCSSYAWDTALKFIETKNEGYSTNNTQGNYKDTTFSYIDLNGDVQTKETGTATLVPTGQTTAVNNIYDMGGNVKEWTTEDCIYPSYPCATRGGSYAAILSDIPAAYRYNISTVSGDDTLGFRSTLYL